MTLAKNFPPIDVHKFERDEQPKFDLYMLSLSGTNPEEWAEKTGYNIAEAKKYLQSMISALNGRGLIGQTHAPYMKSILQDALQKLEL